MRSALASRNHLAIGFGWWSQCLWHCLGTEFHWTQEACISLGFKALAILIITFIVLLSLLEVI
ncbi:hypothetical protein SAMN06296036_1501 [Pseudobacteriovorax antillogorgiicola]|uniref:Uncharacterized protein n=1 Tax=Pseudobacteriovorax antillogorgiicola TaxID=1513793 RepID=A0A1Y6CRN4_9BACT|nr:hypothetical protein EDD56_15013 [Pseudobacteriovorax antillogorgiicola]SMF83864.1 hypothetical protein SAMN06296036_1501 [Pseudobacteriovorax antillogorgiicola]